MKRVGYVHLPRFPIQRLLRETPSLAGREVVLVEERRGTRKVAWASTAALRVGVQVGMTLTAASALFPSLSWFYDDVEAERTALLSLGESLMSLSPGFQLSAPDGLWLDASAAHLVGGEAAFGQAVLEACRAQGYRGQVAIASQLLTARALGRQGNRSVECIDESMEAAALAPLPLSALELPKVRASLASLGVSTLGEVAALPVGALVARMGMAGLLAHRFCRGEDDTPFVAQAPAETLQETMALDWPAESVEPLLFALKTVLDRLAARLSGRGLAAVRLVLTLGLDPGGEVRVELLLARPTDKAKILLELARHRLTDLTLERPIASVAVCVEEHCPKSEKQMGLGEESLGDAALEAVLSRLSTTLGEKALFSADTLETHRPEAAVGTASFRPPEGLPGPGPSEGAGEEAVDDERARKRPLRLLPSPVPLPVRWGPSGAPSTAQVWGREHRVMALSSPERLGGEWWAAQGFERDYYRVYFEGLGPAWVFRDLHDGRFYLQGLFD